MPRSDWLQILRILGGLFLILAIGAAIVLVIFGIGGFPPE